MLVEQASAETFRDFCCMQPALSIKTPISSVWGSSNLHLSERTASAHCNAYISNVKQAIKMPVPSFTAPTRNPKLKTSRFNCVASKERQSDGVQALNTTLDNLAKLLTKSGSIETNEKRSSDLLDLNAPVEECSHACESRGACTPMERLIAENKLNGAVNSPKQKLGKEWREYQGSNNWEGLLDPLDENLRREIVKYGEFVQATYNAFQFDPHSKDYGCCKYPEHSLLDKSGLLNSGYKVTSNIHATSAIQVPQWLTTPFSNSNSDGDQKWMTRRTSWMGFVAVSQDEREIARLGRRDIVVAFRGTATPLEWAENLKDVLTPLNIPEDDHMTTPCSPCGCCLQPKVESGFWSLFTSKDPSGQSASNQMMEEVRRLVDLYKHEEISVTVTGHSLGAALALLTAYQIGAAFNSKESSIPVTVFSFGGPRVGNRAFGRRMEALGCKVLRIVNAHDVVTKIPGVVLNEWMHKMKQRCGNLKKVIGFLEKMPWAYCHVGTELRVDNKDSPYLKPNADMSCCHDLEAYLHLVDGFFSSKTPFRSCAKRNILRLIMNQRSNVLLKATSKRMQLENLDDGDHIQITKKSKSFREDNVSSSPKCVG
eukprot:Gb_40769 [translate_table: standard]